jgi:hypothetical protein
MDLPEPVESTIREEFYMKARKWFIVLGMVAVLGLALAPVVAAADLTVVATPASFAKAADWQKFMASKQIPVKNVAPSDLAAFKDAQYVVLLGPLDEAGGIKPLVEKALIKAEFDQMNQPGSSAMFVKSNVWSQGQEVIIYTGASDKGVETARKANRAEWIDVIFGWFGLEAGVGKAGTPSY